MSCLVTTKKFDLSKFECSGNAILKSSIESEVEIDNDGEKCSSVIENDVPSKVGETTKKDIENSIVHQENSTKEDLENSNVEENSIKSKVGN